MNYVDILIDKVEIMFILIIVGFILRKFGFLSDELQKEMSILMLKIIVSLSIFNSFVSEYSANKAKNILYAFIISSITYALTILIANLFFGKEKYCIENFAIVCANVGFFGIPIINAVLGQEAVMYASIYNAINAVIMWTYGEYILSRDKNNIKILSAIKTPNMIALVLGMLFFFLRISLPEIFKEAMASLNNVNAPMCALMIGASLTGTTLEEMKSDYTHLFSSAVRLILIPSIMILLMSFISNDLLIMKLAMVIISSVPNASAISVFALRHGKDADKAARLTCECTLLCILTMPLMSNIALKIWGI